MPATATPGSTITNTGTVTSDNANTTPETSAATATGTVGAAADVSVVKTLLSGTPVAGGTATWQLVVQNAWPLQAANVVLTDAAPSGVTFESTSPSPACTITAGDLSCALGAIFSGAAVTATVTGLLAADYGASSVSNTAGVATDTADPDLKNNSSSVESSTVTSANLALTKSATSGSFVAGNAATWTVQVSNAGPSTASGATSPTCCPQASVG